MKLFAAYVSFSEINIIYELKGGGTFLLLLTRKIKHNFVIQIHSSRHFRSLASNYCTEWILIPNLKNQDNVKQIQKIK